ncbi:hypothetical protein [Riemerella columbina]|uniref:hypothetical protein n=1 Tax=Riemerella columbina TaxID=103810 RepID=UPI00266F6DEC|nr:hypothetical protein [Riemerella columbina]WKS95511.1 hypothetical protein NYR17_01870 [Riemerella columbina]
MRVFLLCIALFAMVGCQNNEKISDVIPEKRDTVTVVESEENQGVNATNTPAQSSEKTADKVVFTQGNHAIITFNTVSNVGVAHLNNTEYALNQMEFAEDTYTISGKKIKIVAENGDFYTDAKGCTVGTFPEVTVEVGTQQQTLKNVKVQDCSSL